MSIRDSWLFGDEYDALGSQDGNARKIGAVGRQLAKDDGILETRYKGQSRGEPGCLLIAEEHAARQPYTVAGDLDKPLSQAVPRIYKEVLIPDGDLVPGADG